MELYQKDLCTPVLLQHCPQSPEYGIKPNNLQGMKRYLHNGVFNSKRE